MIVVGAGLAGLCCARELHRRGATYVVLEAADDVGGRVRTDTREGFLLDRGFQVLPTAYPECRAVLDYAGLELRAFEPGCIVRWHGAFHRVADPWRRPLAGLRTLFAPVGTLGDKLRVGRLRRDLRRHSIDELLARPARTTLAALRGRGFTEAMIERFFRPFLSGIFLERELESSSRAFEFVFKMFSEGDTVLPARGMQAIPRQIAAQLEPGAVRCGARVTEVDERSVTLDSGETLSAAAVVVAVDGAQASRLIRGREAPRTHGTVCLYFDAPEPPLSGALLVLNAEGEGPVNHLCVPSEVAPSYAPPGRSLVSISLVGDPEGDDAAVEARVRRQMTSWFGAIVGRWRLLRTYRIHDALPAQPCEALEPPHRPVRLDPGPYLCGDHVGGASIQGAMVSGRRAAQALLTGT